MKASNNAMKDIAFKILSNKKVAQNIFEMKLVCGVDLPKINVGQFVQFEIPGRKDLILRRPFCIFDWDYAKKELTLLFEVVGEGTNEMSVLKKGVTCNLLLPLGNGFLLEPHFKNIAVVCGGAGAAPLLALKKCYPNIHVQAYVGFGSKKKAVLVEKFQNSFERVCVCTDDGSLGEKGIPTHFLEEDIKNGYSPDVVLVCGPKGLLKCTQQVCERLKLHALVSVESFMACGVGACLVCACAIRNAQSGNVSNLRACADGPVFALSDLVFDKNGTHSC